MTIEVKLFATLRLHLGVASVSLEVEKAPTVDELIDLISERVGQDVRDFLVGEDGSMRMGTMILLEGKNIIHAQGLATPVTVADVAIFPPAGGG